MSLTKQYIELGEKEFSFSDFITKNKKAILTMEYNMDPVTWKYLKRYWCSKFKNAMKAATVKPLYNPHDVDWDTLAQEINQISRKRKEDATAENIFECVTQAPFFNFPTQNKHNGEPAKLENAATIYRWVDSMRDASNLLIRQELENDDCDSELEDMVQQRVEESLREAASIVAGNANFQHIGPNDLNGLGCEPLDHNLLSQKDTLEKDARSELDEMIARRLNFPGEMEPLIQDMVNKKSSSQAENVEFESSDAEDTGENDYTLPENEYREALELLAQLDMTPDETSKALGSLSTLLDDTGENDYTLPENGYREALELLAQLDMTPDETSKALGSLSTLLD
ncbi:hypothetical protein LRAMOSA05055 [Lichtheimia ramosa]|uniref:Uncharacterized protein n=1 Tax=Lichtheimia ramosa TaxID=688394 RepID=A0A077WZ29_9FUNG|nr:hypothetical protein LRAMOSA05055 [Lichtheimia ramosa]